MEPGRGARVAPMQAPASIPSRQHDGTWRAARRSEDDQGACATELQVRGRPEAVAGAIKAAEPASQGRMIGQLQAQLGNRTVARLLAAVDRPAGPAGPAPAVQRWAVTLPPATADCNVVATWMSAHSPYRTLSGWAITQPTFGWSGDFIYGGSGKSQTVSLANPAVTLSTSVDMPSWSPTDPAMGRAWQAMWADLRRHETRHEDLATTWKATLLDRLKALSLPIAKQADGPAAVVKAWAGWLAEHQADQRSLDPFTAILDCSLGSDDSAESAPPASDTRTATAGDPVDDEDGQA